MPIPLAVALAPAAIGLANSIFGKKKSANVDIPGMTKTITEGSSRQQGIVGNQAQALSALNPAYQTGMTNLGAGYTQTSEDLAKNYQANLAQLGTADTMAAEKAKALNQQEAARNIPLQQQLIREQLAATGGTRTGQAGKAMAAPVTQAAQQASNYSKTLDIQNLQAKSARQQQGVDTLYQSQAGAALQKLGLDRDTMNTLLANNRSDIIMQAAQLLGIDQQQVANLLGIKGIQTNVNIANATGYNANQAALNQGLVELSGAILGKTG